jgi:hypothetical protein
LCAQFAFFQSVFENILAAVEQGDRIQSRGLRVVQDYSQSVVHGS